VTITVPARNAAITRARHAMRHLEQHPATTLAQLGAGRDQLNIASNNHDERAVNDAVHALERIVCTVYRGHPDCR
jgi:hypothetical protein